MDLKEAKYWWRKGYKDKKLHHLYLNTIPKLEKYFVFLGQSGYPFWEYPISGYRYGEVPSCGFSQNKITKQYELGVSIYKVDGEDDIPYTLHQVQHYDIRKRIYVEGYLTPFFGSDQEYLACLVRQTRIESDREQLARQTEVLERLYGAAERCFLSPYVEAYRDSKHLVCAFQATDIVTRGGLAVFQFIDKATGELYVGGR